MHIEEFHRKLIEKLQIDQKNANSQNKIKTINMHENFNAYRLILIGNCFINYYHVDRYAVKLHIGRYAQKFPCKKA